MKKIEVVNKVCNQVTVATVDMESSQTKSSECGVQHKSSWGTTICET